MRDRLKQLEMRIRTSTPAFAKRFYRIARGLNLQPTSPAMPPELITGCQMCASRLDMLQLLPKQGVVAELGTLTGDFARHILSRNQPRALHLIDIDYSRFNDAGLTDGRVSRHQGLTHVTLSTFSDAYFDWIYVDADHSYAGVLRDAQAAAPKIKPGGFIAFNDFAHIDSLFGRYGVHKAAVDFAISARWPMAFFAYDGAGLYDVAFRRPA